MLNATRSCLKAFFPRGPTRFGARSLPSALLAWGLLASIAVATAGANCGIGSFDFSEGFGGSNPAQEDIPSCSKADPINCASGNLTEAHVDLAVGGNGPPLQAARYYNSQLASAPPGSFGPGWTGPYSAHLTFAGGTQITVHHDNGSTADFVLNGATWEAPSWSKATLVKSGENFIYTQQDHTKLELNGSGRLLKITDRHNLSLTMAYNGSGRLETVTNNASLKLTFTYNGSGLVEKITDPMSRVVKYAYSSGRLASVTLPGSATPRWKFEYNGSNDLTAITNGRGYTTSTTYDGAHRATSQTDSLGRKHTFVYSTLPTGSETEITEPNGSITIEKFNEAGAPLSVRQAVGTALETTTTYTYNGDFLVTSAMDPLGKTTSYTYDGAGNKLSEKDPNGNETKYSYDADNDVKTITQPSGQITTFTRNAAGDPTTIVRSGGGITQEVKLEYNASGSITKRIDGAGRVVVFLYDFLGRGLRQGEYSGTISTANRLRGWVYNLNGEVTEEIDGRGYETGHLASEYATKLTRDSQGRVTVTTDPQGDTTKMTYDGNGNVESVTDGLGNITTTVYDATDQPIKVVAANGDERKTTYNSLGQVSSRTDAKGNVSEYKTDALGRVTEVIDPLGRKTQTEYDLAGKPKKITDAEGRAVSYTYDPDGRTTKIDYSEASTADVTFVYDKNGNVVEMTDGTGVTKRVFDGLDRPIEVENGKKEVVKYEYNLAGDITKLTYPNGKAVTRGFDSLGRLISVVDWFGKESKFNYYRNSSLKETIFPAETKNIDEYEYNARGDLTGISMYKGIETLASLEYTMDKARQVKSVSQKGFPESPEELAYEYDPKNRLTKGAAVLYEYDAANRPTRVGSALYTYDKAAQIATASNATFVFNKLGQRTKSTPSSGPATTYAYDQAGNLTSVQRPAEKEVTEINNTFKYDGTGLRTTETNGASTYPMVWDGTAEVPLLLRKGNDYYIYGPEGLPIAQIISSSTHYFHHDHQGSTRILTSSTGAVIGTYEYSPYGDLKSFVGPQSTQIGYAGQYRSHSSRLIYLRARTYDPVTAQFLSGDPMSAQSGEPYSYAADSPVNFGDPTGLTVYGGCVSMSLKTGVGGAGQATGCVVVDGDGNVGVMGFGGFDAWDTLYEWADGLDSYVNRFQSLNGLTGAAKAKDYFSAYFKGQFGWQVGGLYSNANSITDLRGLFNVETTSFSVFGWSGAVTSFYNEKGMYGEIAGIGPGGGLPGWINGPCEQMTFYGWNRSPRPQFQPPPGFGGSFIGGDYIGPWFPW